MELFKGNCIYCGVEPFQVFKLGRDSYIYNGIDRIDNHLGYMDRNCVSCCGFCNRAKLRSTIDELLNWINRIVDYRTNR